MRNGCLNSPFSGKIYATTNSPGQITWSLVDGALPTGLSMAADGNVLTISGTPTATGLFAFIIKAALPTGEYAQKHYAIGIAAISTASLPDGNVGSAYSQTVAISGPTTGAETWQVTSGSLPPGLSLNASTGEITGTPTTEGSYTFIVCFTNSL